MKQQGLVRWNFPFYLMLTAVFVLAYLFFGLNGHVKNLMEQRLSKLNRAPVSIESVRLSISGPSVELKRLVFQDSAHPERAQLSIEDVRLELDFQAFLRNRFVVRQGYVNGVELHPLLLSREDSEHSAKSSLALVSEFLANPNRGQIPEDGIWNAVPSVQATQALQNELGSEVSTWQRQLTEIAREIEVQNTDLKQNLDNETHTKIVKAKLAKARVDLDGLEAKVKADGNVLLSKIGSLAELVPHDTTVVRQAVKLPNLEFKNLDQELGRKLAGPLLTLAEDFYEQLIPWLLAKEQDEPERFGRLQGTDFTFEGRLLPPRLWIQKMELSSKASPDGRVGDLVGYVQDLSSEPHHYPASLNFQASFPKAEVSNAQLEASIDRRNNQNHDKLQFTVAEFPVRDLDFVHTPAVRVGIAQALATMNLESQADGESTILNIKSAMTKISFRNDTQAEALKTVFDAALSPITKLDFQASAQGAFKSKLSSSDFHWSYVSNLSDQLRVELQKSLGQEFAEFSGRIREVAEQKGIEARRGLEERLVTETDSLQKQAAEIRQKLSAVSDK